MLLIIKVLIPEAGEASARKGEIKGYDEGYEYKEWDEKNEYIKRSSRSLITAADT